MGWVSVEERGVESISGRAVGMKAGHRGSPFDGVAMDSGVGRRTVRGGRVDTLATGITRPFPVQGKEGALELGSHLESFAGAHARRASSRPVARPGNHLVLSRGWCERPRGPTRLKDGMLLSFHTVTLAPGLQWSIVRGGYDTVVGRLARTIGRGMRRMRLEGTSVSIRATLTAARANLAKAKVAT